MAKSKNSLYLNWKLAEKALKGCAEHIHASLKSTKANALSDLCFRILCTFFYIIFPGLLDKDFSSVKKNAYVCYYPPVVKLTTTFLKFASPNTLIYVKVFIL